MRFGDFLKKQRKKKGLTQEDLAKALEVSNTYIHQLETTKIDAPSYERCVQLSQVLGIEIEELWAIARKERLEKYAERAGVGLDELFKEIGAEVDGKELTGAEQALVRLYRKLDEKTRKEFNGLIAMLFRYYPEAELKEELDRYLNSA